MSLAGETTLRGGDFLGVKEAAFREKYYHLVAENVPTMDERPGEDHQRWSS